MLFELSCCRSTPGMVPDHIFEIQTSPEGRNSGRAYLLGVSRGDSAEKWVHEINNARAKAKRKEHLSTPLSELQETCRTIYHSTSFQFLIVSLIICNFMCVILNAELIPEEGSDLQRLFHALDISFTGIFTAGRPQAAPLYRVTIVNPHL